MAFDTWFGFDLIQRKTLEKKLQGSTLTTAQLDAINLIAALPTSDPGVAGEVWNDSGTLVASDGA